MQKSISIDIVYVTAIISTFASSSFLVPVLAQDNNNGFDFLPENCAEVPTEMPPFFPMNNRSSTLVFSYERGGGIAGPAVSFERISYDSLTKQLVSLSALDTPEIILLRPEQQKCLEDYIISNRFFEAGNDSSPKVGGDFFTYSLEIIMNNNTNTVYWTDISEGVSSDLLKIVDQIKNLASQ